MSSAQIDKTEFAAIVAVANKDLKNKNYNKPIGVPNGHDTRFELYHSAPSLCSHKVRTVLAEKNIPYMSHDMSIMPIGKAIPQNYRPSYVRLRMLGANDRNYATDYNGVSSVDTQGLDPCVVPTLVDHEAACVVLDSQKICEYLDAHGEPNNSLLPKKLAKKALQQIELVDEAPHVAFLYGRHPDQDKRPEGLAKNIDGVHAKKNRTLRALINHVQDDPALIAAYEAKIQKETAASGFVCDPDSMRNTYKLMEAHIATLEAQLESHNEDWILGSDFTMADIMWTISMYRLKWGGLGHVWEGRQNRQRLNDYLDRAFARPSFQQGVVTWPGAYGPSDHIAEFSGKDSQRRFAKHMRQRISLWEVIFGDPQIKLS